jgi:predicted metal-dependent phosphoesterase TrpH
MPARQPFTALCQAAALKPNHGRADLHLHTTHSDGTYTPGQVVELARRSGLAAIALTDHDTLSGIAAAWAAAAGSSLEIVPGVEISAEFHGRELHLLGYFVRLDDAPLLDALSRLVGDRASRFWTMVERLRSCGVSIEDEELRPHCGSEALGRRHLAEILVKAGKAGTVREAFQRYLGDNGRVAVPKVRLPVAEALARVRGAGGVASWAHPSYDCNSENLAELRDLGLGALEVSYPSYRAGRVRELRALAAQWGLAVSGGSDCHGPEQPRRAVGMCSITRAELERLRHLALR